MYNSKQIILFLFFLFCFQGIVVAQDFNGCITIDFETLPDGTTPTEGTFISDQYFADFGLTFVLEDGTPPVLAEIGNPTTAFGSTFGNDTPAPNQNIGSFFLTDDGLLDDLTSIPVYLNFETPIDSFGGCILDMDFGELFIIEARDINGQPILIDTILAGDAGTGDGISTCWGFNFSGCEGTVYSVRFEGKREALGAFGLGLDNFSFCTGGVDIANEIELESEPLSCLNETSAISILNTGSGDFIYSLDGINFQSDPFFDDLSDGFYTVVVQDTAGCEATFDWDIAFYFEPFIITAGETNTSCGEENGVLTINANASAAVQYSIDGQNFQDSNIFTDLPPGTYEITVIDEFGCFDLTSATIDPSSVFSIQGSSMIDDICNDSEGTATITGTDGGTGNLSYSISSNPGVFQSNSSFTNLPAGTYTLTAMDGLGCEDEVEITIAGGIQILNEVSGDVQNLTCYSNVGSITMLNTGANLLGYSLDGITFQDDPFFPDLSAGDYTVSIQDINDCVEIIDLSVLPYVELNITGILPEHTTCGFDNGTITITANNTNGILYSINNGVDFQTGTTFDSLPPGDYFLMVMDEDSCTAIDVTTILPSIPPVIESIEIEDNLCDSLSGSISITASPGTGIFFYLLNNDMNSNSPDFTNLDGGTYLVTVFDQIGCMDSDTVELITTPPVDVPDIFVQTPDCDAINGVVMPIATGGTGTLWYTLNDEAPTPIDSFTNLPAGVYNISIEDELGCNNDVTATIPLPVCPIFIPNVFTPNGDGANDFFQIFTTRLYDVDVLSYDIYDRWGEHVFSSEAFTINTGRSWWDGMFRGEKSMIAVYAYVIRVRHLNGREEFFKGDVTLLR